MENGMPIEQSVERKSLMLLSLTAEKELLTQNRLYDKKWGKERMVARGKRERRTFLT
jgi:hypothetical protein